ncbi:MAG: RecQ family ATP-dependent helicase [Chitinophagaceae bacterium]|nr:RecQ family ATP-dependent helicase [Chitinophagaceae bacterium]
MNAGTHNPRLTIHDILRQYWGYDSFRPLQEEIINSVLNGVDTLALMPTGGGKSLCYQVPAMAKAGLCLVVSPLIALMKDQVENLRKKNITAFAIYSGMSRKEVINILKTATDSNCKFLYVSPERLETFLFKEYLPGINVNLIAVDEAHCVSQWGYDFRPPYLRIADLREELPGVPVLALTATATKEVQDDICEKLVPVATGLQPGTVSTPPGEIYKHLTEAKSLPTTAPGSWKIFRQPFARPNLSYSVFRVDSKINKLLEILMNVAGSSIVYCKSRKRTQEISELLRLQNISADFYHAGLTAEERTRKQEDWIRNKTRIIVCTNAFGMGIDKPDVRTVIHIDVPDCLENYYQEAGRAGRDGKKSYAVLLYDDNDLVELNELPEIRFPSPEIIKTIYQHLANYLQIHAGSSEGEYFDFDIGDFIKKFKVNSHTAVYSLKALGQEGWLSFNEQVFTPASVQFTTTKNNLHDFEMDHPELEPIIKTLLRAYGGIFDFPTFISELMMVGLLKKDKEDIKKELTQLHQQGLIDYRPQKDGPQILLLRNRIKSEDFTINIARHSFRKEKFILRVKTMIGYVTEKSVCRSKITGNYFGDLQIKDCGICDICLTKKSTSVTKEEFEQIHHLIMQALNEDGLEAKELLHRLSGFKKEKAWKVIDSLQAENKIAIDLQGLIRLK